MGLSKFTLLPRKVQKHPIKNVSWPHINCFIRAKNPFTFFLFHFINLGLTNFSLLPWQFHRYIDLVVDFINLGLAKWLLPQDTIRAPAHFMWPGMYLTCLLTMLVLLQLLIHVTTKRTKAGLMARFCSRRSLLTILLETVLGHKRRSKTKICDAPCLKYLPKVTCFANI